MGEPKREAQGEEAQALPQVFLLPEEWGRYPALQKPIHCIAPVAQ